MAGQKGILQPITIGLGWIITTFICHLAVKKVLMTADKEHGFELSLFITTWQVFIGASLSFPLKIKATHFSSTSHSSTSTQVLVLLFGILHASSMLLTNYSMSQVTASLTHLVKMTEPLCTTILSAIIGRNRPSFSLILVLLSATATALGSEPGQVGLASLKGVMLALMSNLCYALRNTGLKHLGHGQVSLPDFAFMSAGGLFCTIPVWLVTLARGSNILLLIQTLARADTSVKVLFIVCGLFHPVYNLISLVLVLRNCSAVEHALLNVAKRVSIIIGLFIFTYSTTSATPANILSGLFCLVIILVGQKYIKFTILLLLSLVLMRSPQTTLDRFPIKWVGSPPLSVPNTNTILLWTHHQSMSPAVISRLSTLHDSHHDISLICSTSHCLKTGKEIGIPVKRLLLKSACQNTPLQHFVRHQMFFKVALGADFQSTLQLVSALCVRFNLDKPGRLLNPNFNLTVLEDYRGRIGGKILISKNFEFLFEELKEEKQIVDLMNNIVNSLDDIPDLSEIKPIIGSTRMRKILATLPSVVHLDTNTDTMQKANYTFGCFHHDKLQEACFRNGQEVCKRNAGDEMQRLAGLQFMPEVTEWIDFSSLNDYKGVSGKKTLAFGNAVYFLDGKVFLSEAPVKGWKEFQFPPSDSLELLLMSFVTITWPGSLSSSSKAYLSKQVVGARDTHVLGEMRKRNIASYFSGCMTLTLALETKGPSSGVVIIDPLRLDNLKSGKDSLPNLVPAHLLSTAKQYSHIVPSNKYLPHPYRFQFSYGSLLLLAQAKVVVTSRIHVALPAVALGTPVIFLKRDDKKEGGIPAPTRTHGLEDMFHMAYVNTATNRWRFDPNFDWENPPVNPNNGKKKRLVASFWSKIKQYTEFEDAARMFEMVPFKPSPLDMLPHSEQLGVVVLSGSDLIISLRSVESVLFHFPEALLQLIIIQEEDPWKDFTYLEKGVATLTEAGYHVEIEVVPDLKNTKTTGGMWFESRTILLKKPDENARFNLPTEVTNLAQHPAIFRSNEAGIEKLCGSEGFKIIKDFTGINLAYPDGLKRMRGRTISSPCHHILNDFAIFVENIL